MKSILRIFFSITLLLHFISITAQDPERFRNEVDAIGKRYSEFVMQKNLIVFTGSSSVRLWKDLNLHFPDKNIINTGFGGSHMSDLTFYVNDLITRYKPVQVIIYEGDNDIFSGKSPDEVTRQAETLCKLIRERLPETEVVFISAKPSPSRWNLRENYLSLNAKLSGLAGQSDYVYYADIWSIMLNKNGRPDGSLFTADSLHMNDKGYLLWADVLRKQLR